MPPPVLTSNLPREIAAPLLIAATEQLKRSDKGTVALQSLAGISDDLVSLDQNNQEALLFLMRGIFTHPGTGREVLKDAAGID